MALRAGLIIAAPVWLAAQTAPTQSELNCAGYFTRKTVETGLIIQSSEEVGFKNEFGAGDYVYLNKGKDAITAPGGLYMVLRPVKDVDQTDIFPGQKLMLKQMGRLYAEIARIEVAVLHAHSATARIISSCESVLTGDIAVPYNAKAAPAYKSPKFTDRFAPSSGKAMGLIAAAKGFDHWLGEGRIVYLNMGSAQGLQAGSYLRVVRPYRGGGNADFSDAVASYPTEMDGVSLARKMTPAEEATLPREVLGEVMVLKVEEGSATGIITYSRAEVAVGDGVELE